MSAIWGMIDLSGQNIDDAIPVKMTQCISKYKIDKVNNTVNKNVYMGCGLQFITKESRDEVLPIVDGDTFFTADCYLDNRKELISEINSGDNEEKVSLDTPDGALLYLAFRKWGEQFGDHVLGIFSMAIYDRAKNEFYLYTDHTSSRCIYYYIKDEKVFFGTLTGSITDACDEIGICDKWMSACEGIDGHMMLVYEGLTPFENVFILPYGTGIKVSYLHEQLEVQKIRYYDPLSNIVEDKKISDEQAKHIFLDTFRECVQGVLRTDGEVGILLSSGLDSSAVGTMAADIMKDNADKKLRSYTSVPLKDFDPGDDNESKVYLDDETEGVKKICEHYPNILPTFLDCEGKSVLTETEKFVDYLEFPGKSLINHVWMYEAYTRARQDGCKVVMTGSFGNMTISYGDIFRSFYWALREGKILTVIGQLNKLGISAHVSRKRIIKDFISYLRAEQDYNLEEFFDDESFKSELLDRHDVKSAVRDIFEKEGVGRYSRKQYRHNVIEPFVLQLMGMYQTKDGLHTGIIVRDPTKDKRILELCLRFPYRLFAWDAQERRLVREYMAQYVPDEIRKVYSKIGRQSGDAVMRYNKYGLPDGKNPKEILHKGLAKYYDVYKIKQLFDESTDKANLMTKAKILACSYFLDKFIGE